MCRLRVGDRETAPPTTFCRVAAPTGSITLVSFWGKTCCWLHHTFLLGSPNERANLANQDCFLAPLPGSRSISARGVSRFQSLYFVFVLLSLFYFILFAFNYQKHKKISYLHLVYFRVIFCPVFNFAKMSTPENTKLCDFTSTNNNDFICTPIFWC